MISVIMMLSKLADMAFGGVTIEPVMVPEGDRNGRPMLQADWLARGVWEGSRLLPSHTPPARVAFFDKHH